jgi:hypothetical protein
MSGTVTKEGKIDGEVSRTISANNSELCKIIIGILCGR